MLIFLFIFSKDKLPTPRDRSHARTMTFSELLGRTRAMMRPPLRWRIRAPATTSGSKETKQDNGQDRAFFMRMCF